MYVVETLGTPRYISAIFREREKAEEHLNLDSRRRSMRRSGIKYPFYVVEEPRAAGNFFRCVTFTQAQKILANIVLEPDEEHTYLVLYYVTGDFQPKKAGEDEMSRLPHCYVNNSWLRKYFELGDVLLAEMS